ncbi:hypothetical protein B296_00008825 [Ensete ventricosum]|uniref:Uncharacterized protein n=1 Tax=Ensete ventricosum TaxID=4639 RepID=A0A427AZD8_ENSVE|nr:hypothetical protein B296_00008825 [Ensete ventricosum]
MESMLGQMNGSPVSYPGSRLLEWWSSGREEAPQLRSGTGSCKEVGSGAFIVSVVGHSYLVTLLPLWLTMPSYPSTTPVVLATGYPRWVGHVSGLIVRGCEDVAAMSTSAISFFPPSPGRPSRGARLGC